jgi:hypothetical protein
MKNYNMNTVFRFGKYIDKKLLEVCQIDSSYVSWCIINLDNFFISLDNLEDIANQVPDFRLSNEAVLKQSKKSKLIMKDINPSKQKLNTQSDAVIHYIKHLEIDMIETLLDDELTYQDFPKSTFIQNFGVALDEFIQAGDKELFISNGFCSEFICNNQCSGYRFSSKASGLYFDLIIDIENGQVIDIYECSSFLCLSSDSSAKQRVRIDRRDIKINIEKPPKDLF